MRILVCGGGTGGHILPVLAVADWLKSHDPDIDILYVGQGDGMEAQVVASAGLKFAAIKAGKFRRYHERPVWHALADVKTLWLNTRDLFRVLAGVWQSRRILSQFKPDIIFIKGGYVGLPIGLAARLAHMPYIIHESDTLPGLTNRSLAPKATAIAVAWPPGAYKTWPPDKLTFTGIPIRESVLAATPAASQKHFGFSDKWPIVGVIGGSQGAQVINQAVVTALPELTKFAQVLHITGEHDIESVRFEVSRLALDHPDRYRAIAFLGDDWGQALAASDIVISRAGANSLAELAALAKPTILIPNPRLTGGHQSANAQAWSRLGAARVITEDRLTPKLLVEEVRRLAGSADERNKLQAAMATLAVRDGARRLGQLILATARRQHAA